jgi:integrase
MARPKAAGRRTGSLVERSPGRWLVRWFIGKDAAGKRQYDSKTIVGNKKDAEAFLATVVVAVDKGTYVAPSKKTLGEWLNAWLDHEAKRKISVTTLKNYRMRLKTIIANIGHIKLSALTDDHIQEQYSKMLDEQKLDPRTVHYSHTVLKQALRRAVKKKFLMQNPCDDLVLPRQVRSVMVVWTEPQVSLFLEQTKDDEFHLFWHLLFATGLRPQEAFALKWENLDGGKLRVQRGLTKTETYGVYEVGQTKTKNGDRTVTLPEATIAKLKAHKAAQAAQMLAAGPAYARDGFVFADERGKHLYPPTLTNRWLKLVARSGLPRMTMYGCRHTHATILLRACVNPKVVAERLGHGSVVITLNQYSHVLPDTQEGVAAKIDGLLFKTA